MLRTWIACALALGLCSCATYREDLNRGERLYSQDKDYERALAIWRSLEADRDSLSLQDQARYAYLRGMTDYRLGFRADARHWLAIAKAIEQEHPGGLQAPEKTRLEESLTDLNKDVYGGAESFEGSSSTVKETTVPVQDESGCSPACAEGETCQSGECVVL
ncbi:MAG: hypothetical protein H6718_35830 [Polyangiaceae bacterium]|nr:hypothetical protein [Myxococcales bacterium]MCB9590834.1 hypothetical protein [Polyangiaceae bacterium]